MWYVIQVRTGQEHKTALACQRCMVEESESVFIPVSEVWMKSHGQKELREKRLFPGYVFFATEDVEDLFFRLKSIPALTKLLRTGEDFTPLYEEEQVALEALMDPQHRIKTSVGYIEGDQVKVTAGPLKGWSGRIAHIDRHKYTARLEIEFMGELRQIPVGLEILSKQP